MAKDKKSGKGEGNGRDPELDLRSVLAVPGEPKKARAMLAEIHPSSLPAGPQNKDAAADRMTRYATELQDLQERLFAYAHGPADRRVLLVLQGMDTSGKGGTIEKTVGLLNPSGLELHSFKAPSAEERRHHFLWRVRNNLPHQGQIGIFDRSHYEDVLIQRVHQMADAETIESRYAEINDFEQELISEGYSIVKCFLNISKDEQKERLLARLDDPHKHWKFNTGDIDERQHWEDYQEAYFLAMTRCSTPGAQWYAVPSDRKWYRNWAVGRLLLETLREINPQYPEMDFDVDQQRARLLAED